MVKIKITEIGTKGHRNVLKCIFFAERTDILLGDEGQKIDVWGDF